MRLIIAIAVIASALGPWLSAPAPAEAASCQFVLGFKALHDMIPDKVGDCLVSEHHNPLNGDGLQETTAWHGKGGLLVWRKADNWTAFTDGSTTWINGPKGLQSRPNAGPLFDWEKPDQTWAVHDDEWRTFKYPSGWASYTEQVKDDTAPGGTRQMRAFMSKDGRAIIAITTPPMDMGSPMPPAPPSTSPGPSQPGGSKYTTLKQETTTINGRQAVIVWMQSNDASKMMFLFCVIGVGNNAHMIFAVADPGKFGEIEPQFLESFRSYVGKK